MVLAFLISIVFSYEDLAEDSSAREQEQEQEQEQSDNPDYEVKLSVDTAPKSPTVITSEELETVAETLNPTNTDLFSCHECTDCYSNGEIKTQMCQTGTRHCYVKTFELLSIKMKFSETVSFSDCRQFTNVSVM